MMDLIQLFKHCLKCYICKSVLVAPVKYQRCQHSFCQSCINSKGVKELCPQCGLDNSNSIVTDEILNNFVEYWRNTSLKWEIENDELLEMNKKMKYNKGRKSEKLSTEKRIQNRKTSDEQKKKLNVSVSKHEVDVTKRSFVESNLSIRSLNKSITLTEKNIEKRNSKGETPLHEACIKGNVAKLKMLLSVGAEPNTKDNAGWTPLQEAADKGCEDIVKVLLENGANPDLPGYENSTPLHMAIINNHVTVIKMLLEYGCNVNARNLHNITPKMLLSKSGNMQNVLTLSNAEKCISLSQHVIVCNKKVSKVVFYCPNLNKNQIEKLARIIKTSSLNMTRSFKFDQSVTHVILDTKDDLLCDISVPVLLALLCGKWIISSKWIDEEGEMERFEVKGVTSFPQCQAPRRSRICHMNQLPGLFNGCHIYFSGPIRDVNMDTITLSRYLLNQFVEMGEGIVLKREPNPELIEEIENTSPYHADAGSILQKCSHYIIYGSDIEEPAIKYNMPHIKSLSLQWLINCILNYKLINPC